MRFPVNYQFIITLGLCFVFIHGCTLSQTPVEGNTQENSIVFWAEVVSVNNSDILCHIVSYRKKPPTLIIHQNLKEFEYLKQVGLFISITIVPKGLHESKPTKGDILYEVWDKDILEVFVMEEIFDNEK